VAQGGFRHHHGERVDAVLDLGGADEAEEPVAAHGADRGRDHPAISDRVSAIL
jgi:hypothetical protein